MGFYASPQNVDYFLPQRNTLLIRGLVLTVTGSLLIVFSIVAPDVKIMSQSSAWLPMVAFVILLTGLLACLDTYILRHSKEFFVNLQIAVLDTVIGVFLLTELNRSEERIILLAAAYLLIKGIFRVFAALTVAFINANTAVSGGLLSVFLGVLLWQGWPSSSMWFICFCLSVDIMTRGLALTRFGLWLKGQYKIKETENL
ncbi:MAG: hypothetical protein ISR72_04340 [Methylobacter sp.]|nr:hypothetical protein [Methylobacter sp.]